MIAGKTKEIVLKNPGIKIRDYKKIQIGSPLTEELDEAIEIFMHHINYEDGMSEDCYRMEVEFWLKDSFHRLPKEEYEIIMDYYVLGGVFDDYGPPRKYSKKQ